MKIIAHRGAAGLAKENTLTAIEEGMRNHADFLEIDVRLSKDGEIILLHDEDLQRLWNESYRPEEQNLAELKKASKGEIATLEEVIQAVKGKAKLLIELKAEEDADHGLERKVFRLLHAENVVQDCIIQSFSTSALERFAEIDHIVTLHKLIEEGDKHELEAFFVHPLINRVSGINLHYEMAGPDTITRIHSILKSVFAWTVNEKEVMRNLIAYGIDGIISDYPDRLSEVLSEQPQQQEM